MKKCFDRTGPSDSETLHPLIVELRDARKKSALSQKALADLVGISAPAVSRLEAGIGTVANLATVMVALDFQIVGLGSEGRLEDQLLALRTKRRWSQDQLAGKTQLSAAAIADLEAGGGTITALLRVLAVLAPRAQRRAQERAYWGAGDKADRDSRFTPADFMASVYDAFGPVDLDPCGHVLSPVTARRRILLSEGGDGLIEDWSGQTVFINPPYSALLKWLRRAYEQRAAGNVRTVICLIPVRTDSRYFHEILSSAADIFFLEGRVRFIDPQGKRQSTPFSLMLLTLGATAKQKVRFAELVRGVWYAPVRYERMLEADDNCRYAYAAVHAAPMECLHST